MVGKMKFPDQLSIVPGRASSTTDELDEVEATLNQKDLIIIIIIHTHGLLPVLRV
jgi:hypothetical protein